MATCRQKKTHLANLYVGTYYRISLLIFDRYLYLVPMYYTPPTYIFTASEIEMRVVDMRTLSLLPVHIRGHKVVTVP